VLSVAHVGHLIPARTLAPYPTYDAETFFLETYAAFPRIDLNLHDRVQRTTVITISTSGSTVVRDSIVRPVDVGPNAHSPVLLPFYPFGYYALAATWMRAFGGSADSIVECSCRPAPIGRAARDHANLHFRYRSPAWRSPAGGPRPNRRYPERSRSRRSSHRTCSRIT
jgi:hypothetical protein